MASGTIKASWQECDITVDRVIPVAKADTDDDVEK